MTVQSYEVKEMQEENQSVQQVETRPKPQKTSNKNQQTFLIILIVLVVAAAAVILYRNGVLGGSSGQDVVEKYLNAICQKDFDSYVSTMPPKIADDHRNDRAELGLDGAEYMRQLYADYFEEFGDDMTVQVTFTGKSRPDAVYVDNFKQSYEEIYGEELKLGTVFEIDVSALFSGEKSRSIVEIEFYTTKIQGEWRVVGADYKTEDADSPES